LCLRSVFRRGFVFCLLGNRPGDANMGACKTYNFKMIREGDVLDLNLHEEG
jgi:hypothetical protein